MRATYRILKGISQAEASVGVMSGVLGAWRNPFGKGHDVLEVELHCTQDPEVFPMYVRDASTGNVVIEGPIRCFVDES